MGILLILISSSSVTKSSSPSNAGRQAPVQMLSVSLGGEHQHTRLPAVSPHHQHFHDKWRHLTDVCISVSIINWFFFLSCDLFCPEVSADCEWLWSRRRTVFSWICSQSQDRLLGYTRSAPDRPVHKSRSPQVTSTFNSSLLTWLSHPSELGSSSASTKKCSSTVIIIYSLKYVKC